MTQLCGKGIWLAHSYDLERAAEMATHMGGTHLLIKVGHGPHYFPETTRDMLQRVRALGLYSLAWIRVTDQAPQDAHKAIVRALALGYRAAVLFLSADTGAGNMTALADALINVEIPRERLFLASPPLPYVTYANALEALVPVCQGGWMPLCSPAWGNDARDVIDRDVYHSLGDLSLMWGTTPEVYPVLSPRNGSDERNVLPEEFIPWVEGIARHGVDFFSVFHAVSVEKALWPMLQSINIACMDTDEQAAIRELSENASTSTVPQPVYVTVKASDTVWGFISRHGMTREQFWEWNAHLWDSRGLPRDPDYLQEGWRLRVK
ncbi:MAG: LysM peptidoglycan-binding domain-containing protein [Anaerolineae bacterium]